MKKPFTLNTLSPLQRSPSGQANPPQAGNTISTLFFYCSILIFIIGFNFTDTPPPFGWYQQFMPNLNGASINDLTFVDSLTGFAVTNVSSSNSYIFKTTNGGDNWFFTYNSSVPFQRVEFINSTTGFVNANYDTLYKTTNGGNNWNTILLPMDLFSNDMAVLNQDTIWLVHSEPLTGGVFLTTNGGANWVQQLALGISNPDHIYMFNGRIGFISRTNSYIRKTTDGGQSWFVLVNNKSFNDILFVDSLKGWYALDSVRTTTDGGLNWQTQVLPYGTYNGGYLNYSYIFKFSSINRDTIWGVGGRIAYPNTQLRGLIYKTINGGDNWLFQLPDTNIGIGQYLFVKFINKLNGWAYSYNGVHTVTGGDSIWYFGIQKISSEIPKDFAIKQNYPNPFNPRTVIPYSLKSAGYVRIIAYDILGREVQRLVDQKQSAGEYEVDFMGKFTATGVYFYRMTVDPSTGSGQAFIDTKKMILLK